MYMRKDAIYPATVVGKPPQEDKYLGDYSKYQKPLIKVIHPEIHDFGHIMKLDFIVF